MTQLELTAQLSIVGLLTVRRSGGQHRTMVLKRCPRELMYPFAVLIQS